MEATIKEKSYRFSVRIVKLSRYLQETKREHVMTKQLLRAGTSVGANIREAFYPHSKADFIAKLQIARKTPFTEEMITKWLKQFCAGDAMDLAFRQKIIDVLISRVYLFDDKVIIYYNIDRGKQISFIDMLEDAGEAPSPAPPCAGCPGRARFRSGPGPRR